MTINKDLLVAASEKYVTNTVGNLFGISSLPAQALMKYAVRNIANKYGMIFDIFSDKDGNIDSELLLNAVRAELKNRGGQELYSDSGRHGQGIFLCFGKRQICSLDGRHEPL